MAGREFAVPTRGSGPSERTLRRLITLPAQDATGVAMLAPALIDYSLWLDEETSPLRDQIDVMSAIAGTAGSYAVHPYVPFCPWRQLVQPDLLPMVQEAVERRGFIGVKMYPVMGFRPYGNAVAADGQTLVRFNPDFPGTTTSQASGAAVTHAKRALRDFTMIAVATQSAIAASI